MQSRRLLLFVVQNKLHDQVILLHYLTEFAAYNVFGVPQ